MTNMNSGSDYPLQIGPASGVGSCAGASLAKPGLLYEGDVLAASPPGTLGPPLATCLDPSSLGLVSIGGKRLLGGDALVQLSPAAPLAQTVGTLTAASGTTLPFGPGGFGIDVTSPLATLVRSGSLSGTFTDGWDTVQDFTTQIQSEAGSGWLSIGQIYQFRICNTTSATETLAVPSSSSTLGTVQLSGTQTVAPGSCQTFAATVTGTASGGTLLISGR